MDNNKKFQQLRDRLSDIEPTKKTSFSPSEVAGLFAIAEQAEAKGPEAKQMALEIARKKLGKQPEGVDLANFSTKIAPPDALNEARQMVKGSGGHIEDISRVSDKVPLDGTKNVIKGVTDKLSKDYLKELTGDEFTTKIASSLSKGKKLAAGLPLVGGLAGLASGDLFAATPVVGDALETEELGPDRGSLEYKLESGDKLSDDEKRILFKDLRGRYE